MGQTFVQVQVYQLLQSISITMKIMKQYDKDKQFFRNLPKSQRSAWLRQMIKRVPEQRQYKTFMLEYPNSGKWQYRNFNLHYQYCKSQSQPKAIMFYFHGFNTHGGQSGYLGVNIANNLSVDVYALDMINFGQSEGPLRGYIQSLDDLLQQAEGFIQHIVSKYGNSSSIKIFLSGLSFGGAICFKLTLRKPQRYSGCILLSPAIRQNAEVSPFLKRIGKWFSKLSPQFKIVSQQFNNQSRIDQTERVLADPHIFKDKLMLGPASIVLETMYSTSNQYKQFKAPFILIQAGIDKYIDPFAAVDLESQCQSSDKTVFYIKDMWHTIFMEEQIQFITPVIKQWLDQRL